MRPEGDDSRTFLNPQTGRDLDGDGLVELVIGDPSREGNVGGVWIIPDVPTDGSFGDQGVLWEGTSAGGYAGISPGSQGDLSGDGRDDAIVTEIVSVSGDSYEMRAYVLEGPATSGGTLDDAAVTITSSRHTYGVGVPGLGDHDGDGAADLLLSAVNLVSESVDVFVWYGPLESASLDVSGADISLEVGGRSAVGMWNPDLDGDGTSEILVADPTLAEDAGAIYLFYGQGL